MLLAREADQRQLKLQRQGRMGTFGPCTGEEGAVCAAALAMTDKDWYVGAYREIGMRLMRGVRLAEEYLFWNGFEEGSHTAAAERTLPNAVIVGSQIPHAVGVAYAMKYRRERSAVLTCFGDGATSQGDFHEALNWAAVWKLPVVFLCLNNGWAISLPRSRQTNSRTIAQKAVAYDMAGIQLDGNDPLAVYAAVRDALQRAYAGEGPTLIEAVTYRLMMHTTADDPTRYRAQDEEQSWWGRDPILRFRTYLEAKGILPPELQKRLSDEVKAEVDAAVREFESRTDFKPDAPFDHVYGTRHPIIEEQRAEFLEHLRLDVEEPAPSASPEREAARA
jgi:pyruvate dehydrogenase E1 component alpha subunit